MACLVEVLLAPWFLLYKGKCVVSAHGGEKYGHFLGQFKLMVGFVHILANLRLKQPNTFLMVFIERDIFRHAFRAVWFCHRRYLQYIKWIVHP